MSDCTQVEVNAYPLQVEAKITKTVVEVLRGANITVTDTIDFANLPVFANNQAALDGGLNLWDLYRTRDGILKIVYDPIEFVNITVNLSSQYSYFMRAF